MLKIFIPNNIYSRLLIYSIPQFKNSDVSFLPSSSIAKGIRNGGCDIAVIPSLDLLNYSELFVSKTIGISFEGGLSNSYLYFKPETKNIEKLLLTGDVSVNEIIISKILFLERFEIEIEQILTTKKIDLFGKNYLLVGDQNFQTKYLKSGLSLADEISDQIEMPYVNFVMVSKNEELLNFSSEIIIDINSLVEENLKSILSSMDWEDESKNFFISQFRSLNFNLQENSEALVELLRLPYYHRLVEEMKELKFK